MRVQSRVHEDGVIPLDDQRPSPQPVEQLVPIGCVEDLGDRFIAATIDFPQHENFTMLITEDRERLANLPATFLSFEVFQRSVFRIDRFLAAVVSCLVDRKNGATTTSL